MPRSTSFLGSLFFVLAVTALTPARGADAPAPVWTSTTTLTVRVGWDGNVYLQSVTARADHGSAFATAIPAWSATWKPSGGLTLVASYAPEFTVYGDAASENHVAHKLAANFSGQSGAAKWEWGNQLTVVAGDDQGPVYTGTGGSAILGGVPLLERRDQTVVRQNFKAQWPVGGWFARLVASTYLHDFRTEQRTSAGYQNYIDRGEVVGGADWGRKVGPALTLFGGFRFGRQSQSASPVSAFQYDNDLRRFLVGVEAVPAAGLKLSLLAGPDRRSFADTVPGTFERSTTRLYLEAAGTATVGKTDTATLTAKQFALPGYGGGSFLEIKTFDFSWKHTFRPALSATLAGRVHHWEFAKPVVRDEWWHGASLAIAGKAGARWTWTATLAFDEVSSEIPNTPGREASRTTVSLAGTRAF